MTNLPLDSEQANLVARVYREALKGPSVCIIRNTRMLDITCIAVPTVRDLLEQGVPGEVIRFVFLSVIALANFSYFVIGVTAVWVV